MMNRNFFPDMTEQFDASVRQTLAALPEKRRARRMTAGKITAIALAAALCLGGTALAASGGLFPLLFPGDGGEAVSGYVRQPEEPAAENDDWRLTVDSVLFDESSLTGLVSLRLEDLNGEGKMPFKTIGVLPEYRKPGMSWAALDEINATEDGECHFEVLDAAGEGAFTGPFYLDTERSTDKTYYIEAALIAFPDYVPGEALTLGMYQLGEDEAVLSVTLPEPQAMPGLKSADGAVTLSQIGLRIELDADEAAVDIVDYVALRTADGSETVIIDKAKGIDRTLYALGTATDPVSLNDSTYTTGIPGPAEGSCNAATYLLAVTPELENVRSVVVNDMEYALA